jgi:hypothetical protein
VDPFAVDLFAVGMIIHRLLLGDWPTNNHQRRNVATPRANESPSNGIRRSMEQLLGDPRSRLSAAALCHSQWMEGHLKPVMQLLSVFKLFPVENPRVKLIS